MLNAKNKDGGCEEWASEVEGASPSGWLLGREAGALPLEPLERRRKLSPEALPPGEKRSLWVGGWQHRPPKNAAATGSPMVEARMRKVGTLEHCRYFRCRPVCLQRKVFGCTTRFDWEWGSRTRTQLVTTTLALALSFCAPCSIWILRVRGFHNFGRRQCS